MKEKRLKRGMHTHLKALKRGKTLTQALTSELRRKSPKCEALGPKIQNPSLQNPIRTSQKAVMASKIPEGSWNGTRVEEPEEMGEKLRRGRLFKFSASTNRLTTWSTVNAVNASIFVHFLVS